MGTRVFAVEPFAIRQAPVGMASACSAIQVEGFLVNAIS